MNATQATEALCELTSRMLKASEADKWEQVTAMDAQRRKLLEQFRSLGNEGKASPNSLDKLKQLDEQLKANATRARDDIAGKMQALRQQESGKAAYRTTSRARG